MTVDSLVRTVVVRGNSGEAGGEGGEEEGERGFGALGENAPREESSAVCVDGEIQSAITHV